MLIGRGTELAAVAAAVGGLASGKPFVLSFSGDDGSGRSSLLDAATAEARAAGALVLAARGSGSEPGPAYSGLLALLRPLEPNLDELAAPEQVAAVQSALSIRSESVDAVDVGVGVLRVLAGAAERGPVVLAVDDAAAVDPASTSAITFALARLGVDPIGAFLALPATTTSWDEVVTKRVVLGPLGMADLATIVKNATECTPEAAPACADWAAGSPMLALELARSLSDDERRGRSPLPTVPRATGRAVERLQERLDRLSDQARRACVVVAASRFRPASSLVLRALEALGEPVGGLDDAEDAGHLQLRRWRGGVHPSVAPPALLPPRRRVQPARGAPRPGRRAHRTAARRRTRRGTSSKRASALTTTSPPRSSWSPPTPGGVGHSPSRPPRSNGRPR